MAKNRNDPNEWTRGVAELLADLSCAVGFSRLTEPAANAGRRKGAVICRSFGMGGSGGIIHSDAAAGAADD